MKSVVLIGPQCCGKTSTGKSLSSLLHIPFIDGDDEFFMQYGSITDYVSNHGFTLFRQRENEILARICIDNAFQDVVLTPGGGAVAHNQGNEYRESNCRLLNSFGEIVYILPSPDLEESLGILVSRYHADAASVGSRPALNGIADITERLRVTLQERHPLYQKVAHHIIYTGDKTPDQVALGIIQTVFPELLS